MDRKEGVSLSRREAYESSRDKWIKNSQGERIEGFCGFCHWVRLSVPSDCARCPLYSTGVCTCDDGGSLFKDWKVNKTTENAMKVLEGVIKYGLPWVEEEEGKKNPMRYYYVKVSDIPEPKFKVGDRVLVGEGSVGIVAKSNWSGDTHHNHASDHWHYVLETGNWIYDEDELEPAPKKVWKDVTLECEPRLFGYGGCVAMFYHQGRWIFSVGYDGVRINEGCTNEYKVEQAGKRGPLHGFRVLHLQDEE